MQFVFRFLVGGIVVTLFAALGDALKPKSFAGLFGAAPSIAIATLGLTIFKDGKLYAATEARSMIAGAAAFLVYASVCSRVLMKYRFHVTSVTIAVIMLWLGVSFGIWQIFLR